MRLAIISDIHGNLIALEAALADIERESPDQIVCLGDVAELGPQPRQTVERLKPLNCPVVMGNTDEWLLNPDEPSEPDDEDARRMEEIAFWCLHQLSAADLDYLRTFPATVEIPLGSDITILCFHGSPRSNRERIIAATPDEELEPMLSGFTATVMAGGHTHAQLLRRFRDGFILNPGSVGLPIERTPTKDRRPPWAEYALIGYENGRLSIELRRAPVDVATVVRAAHESGMPHAEWWSKDWG
jgi:putative phosphoesterase